LIDYCLTSNISAIFTTKPSYKNYVNLDTTGATGSLITLFLFDLIGAVFDENTFNNIAIIYI